MPTFLRSPLPVLGFHSFVMPRLCAGVGEQPCVFNCRELGLPAQRRIGHPSCLLCDELGLSELAATPAGVKRLVAYLVPLFIHDKQGNTAYFELALGRVIAPNVGDIEKAVADAAAKRGEEDAGEQAVARRRPRAQKEKSAASVERQNHQSQEQENAKEEDKHNGSTEKNKKDQEDKKNDHKEHLDHQKPQDAKCVNSREAKDKMGPKQYPRAKCTSCSQWTTRVVGGMPMCKKCDGAARGRAATSSAAAVDGVSKQETVDKHKENTEKKTTKDQAIELKMQPQYLEQITAGQKTVEGRLNSGKMKAVQPGDVLRCVSGFKMLRVRVLSVKCYHDFASMLSAEGLAACLPGCASLEQGVSIYRKFPWYATGEQVYGVLALRIRPLSDEEQKNDNTDNTKTNDNKDYKSGTADSKGSKRKRSEAAADTKAK